MHYTTWKLEFVTNILWIIVSGIFYQIFFSPQMKLSAIITYNHGIYELPHELPNELRLIMPTACSPMGGLKAHTRKKRLRLLGNQETSGNSENLRMIA